MKQQRRKTQKKHGGDVPIENINSSQIRMGYGPSSARRKAAPEKPLGQGKRPMRGSEYSILQLPMPNPNNEINLKLTPIKKTLQSVEKPVELPNVKKEEQPVESAPVKKTLTVVKVIRGVPTKVEEEEIIGGRRTHRRHRHTSRRR